MKLSLPIRDKALRASFQLSLVFWIAQVFALFSSWRYLPPQLPLFYSRPWGEEQLTNPVGMLILPGLSIGIILANLVINLIITKEEVLIRQIIAAAAAVFNLLSLITLVKIIRLIV